MDALLQLSLMGAALAILYQARRVQDGKSQGIQPPSKNWVVFSLVPLGLVALEIGFLFADGDLPTHVPIMVIMGGLTTYMWWQAWRLRQSGQ